MSKMTDREFLATDQYEDASKFSARVQFHARFGTNPYSWFLWVFDHLNLPPCCRILELGCGPASLWCENMHRISPGWLLALSDVSAGMLKQARKNLSSSTHSFAYATADAQAIPFADGSFDGAIANQVLYHVSDRSRALCEIVRVIRPAGSFYASTVGQSHLHELADLLHRFDPGLTFFWGDSLVSTFTLETGYGELSQWFSHVSLARYEDKLVVTESEPLVAFVLASLSSEISRKRQQALIQFVEKELESYGAIQVTRDIGLFEAISS